MIPSQLTNLITKIITAHYTMTQKSSNEQLLLGWVIGQKNPQPTFLLHKAHDNLITTSPFTKYEDHKTKTTSHIFKFLNNKVKMFYSTY